MASNQLMFSMRIVTVDSYMADPVPSLDPCFSDFRKQDVKTVPVVRIFGSTPLGQTTCLHLHGVFPYLMIPFCGPDVMESHWTEIERYMQQMAVSLDTALNSASGKSNSSRQRVYKIVLLRGIPFYGYHEDEELFLKVYFYLPGDIKRAAELLQAGAVMNRQFQPHEAHVPYVLQLFLDYNLYGMNLLHARNCRFRAPLGKPDAIKELPKIRRPEDPDSQENQGEGDSKKSKKVAKLEECNAPSISQLENFNWNLLRERACGAHSQPKEGQNEDVGDSENAPASSKKTRISSCESQDEEVPLTSSLSCSHLCKSLMSRTFMSSGSQNSTEETTEKLDACMCPLHTRWTRDNIPPASRLPQDIDRHSTRELEVDIIAADVSNRNELANKSTTNPGIASIWEDERARRRERGQESQIVPEHSQVRPIAEDLSGTEARYVQMLYDALDRYKEENSLASSFNDSHPFSTSTQHVARRKSSEDSASFQDTAARKLSHEDARPRRESKDLFSLSPASSAPPQSEKRKDSLDDSTNSTPDTLTPIVSEEIISQVINSARSQRARSKSSQNSEDASTQSDASLLHLLRRMEELDNEGDQAISVASQRSNGPLDGDNELPPDASTQDLIKKQLSFSMPESQLIESSGKSEEASQATVPTTEDEDAIETFEMSQRWDSAIYDLLHDLSDAEMTQAEETSMKKDDDDAIPQLDGTSDDTVQEPSTSRKRLGCTRRCVDVTPLSHTVTSDPTADEDKISTTGGSKALLKCTEKDINSNPTTSDKNKMVGGKKDLSTLKRTKDSPGVETTEFVSVRNEKVAITRGDREVTVTLSPCEGIDKMLCCKGMVSTKISEIATVGSPKGSFSAGSASTKELAPSDKEQKKTHEKMQLQSTSISKCNKSEKTAGRSKKSLSGSEKCAKSAQLESSDLKTTSGSKGGSTGKTVTSKTVKNGNKETKKRTTKSDKVKATPSGSSKMKTEKIVSQEPETCWSSRTHPEKTGYTYKRKTYRDTIMYLNKQAIEESKKCALSNNNSQNDAKKSPGTSKMGEQRVNVFTTILNENPDLTLYDGKRAELQKYTHSAVINLDTIPPGESPNSIESALVKITTTLVTPDKDEATLEEEPQKRTSISLRKRREREGEKPPVCTRIRRPRQASKNSYVDDPLYETVFDSDWDSEESSDDDGRNSFWGNSKTKQIRYRDRSCERQRKKKKKQKIIYKWIIVNRFKGMSNMKVCLWKIPPTKRVKLTPELIRLYELYSPKKEDAPLVPVRPPPLPPQAKPRPMGRRSKHMLAILCPFGPIVENASSEKKKTLGVNEVKKSGEEGEMEFQSTSKQVQNQPLKPVDESSNCYFDEVTEAEGQRSQVDNGKPKETSSDQAEPATSKTQEAEEMTEIPTQIFCNDNKKSVSTSSVDTSTSSDLKNLNLRLSTCSSEGDSLFLNSDLSSPAKLPGEKDKLPETENVPDTVVESKSEDAVIKTQKTPPATPKMLPEEKTLLPSSSNLSDMAKDSSTTSDTVKIKSSVSKIKNAKTSKRDKIPSSSKKVPKKTKVSKETKKTPISSKTLPSTAKPSSTPTTLLKTSSHDEDFEGQKKKEEMINVEKVEKPKKSHKREKPTPKPADKERIGSSVDKEDKKFPTKVGLKAKLSPKKLPRDKKVSEKLKKDLKRKKNSVKPSRTPRNNASKSTKSKTVIGEKISKEKQETRTIVPVCSRTVEPLCKKPADDEVSNSAKSLSSRHPSEEVNIFTKLAPLINRDLKPKFSNAIKPVDQKTDEDSHSPASPLGNDSVKDEENAKTDDPVTLEVPQPEVSLIDSLSQELCEENSVISTSANQEPRTVTSDENQPISVLERDSNDAAPEVSSSVARKELDTLEKQHGILSSEKIDTVSEQKILTGRAEGEVEESTNKKEDMEKKPLSPSQSEQPTSGIVEVEARKAEQDSVSISLPSAAEDISPTDALVPQLKKVPKPTPSRKIYAPIRKVTRRSVTEKLKSISTPKAMFTKETDDSQEYQPPQNALLSTAFPSPFLDSVCDPEDPPKAWSPLIPNPLEADDAEANDLLEEFAESFGQDASRMLGIDESVFKSFGSIDELMSDPVVNFVNIEENLGQQDAESKQLNEDKQLKHFNAILKDVSSSSTPKDGAVGEPVTSHLEDLEEETLMEFIDEMTSPSAPVIPSSSSSPKFQGPTLDTAGNTEEQPQLTTQPQSSPDLDDSLKSSSSFHPLGDGMMQHPSRPASAFPLLQTSTSDPGFENANITTSRTPVPVHANSSSQTYFNSNNTGNTSDISNRPNSVMVIHHQTTSETRPQQFFTPGHQNVRHHEGPHSQPKQGVQGFAKSFSPLEPNGQFGSRNQSSHFTQDTNENISQTNLYQPYKKTSCFSSFIGDEGQSDCIFYKNKGFASQPTPRPLPSYTPTVEMGHFFSETHGYGDVSRSQVPAGVVDPPLQVFHTHVHHHHHVHSIKEPMAEVSFAEGPQMPSQGTGPIPSQKVVKEEVRVKNLQNESNVSDPWPVSSPNVLQSKSKAQYLDENQTQLTAQNPPFRSVSASGQVRGSLQKADWGQAQTCQNATPNVPSFQGLSVENRHYTQQQRPTFSSPAVVYRKGTNFSFQYSSLEPFSIIMKETCQTPSERYWLKMSLTHNVPYSFFLAPPRKPRRRGKPQKPKLEWTPGTPLPTIKMKDKKSQTVQAKTPYGLMKQNSLLVTTKSGVPAQIPDRKRKSIADFRATPRNTPTISLTGGTGTKPTEEDKSEDMFDMSQDMFEPSTKTSQCMKYNFSIIPGKSKKKAEDKTGNKSLKFVLSKKTEQKKTAETSSGCNTFHFPIQKNKSGSKVTAGTVPVPRSGEELVLNCVTGELEVVEVTPPKDEVPLLFKPQEQTLGNLYSMVERTHLQGGPNAPSFGGPGPSKSRKLDSLGKLKRVKSKHVRKSEKSKKQKREEREREERDEEDFVVGKKRRIKESFLKCGNSPTISTPEYVVAAVDLHSSSPKLKLTVKKPVTPNRGKPQIAELARMTSSSDPEKTTTMSSSRKYRLKSSESIVPDTDSSSDLDFCHAPSRKRKRSRVKFDSESDSDFRIDDLSMTSDESTDNERLLQLYNKTELVDFSEFDFESHLKTVRTMYITKTRPSCSSANFLVTLEESDVKLALCAMEIPLPTNKGKKTKSRMMRELISLSKNVPKHKISAKNPVSFDDYTSMFEFDSLDNLLMPEFYDRTSTFHEGRPPTPVLSDASISGNSSDGQTENTTDTDPTEGSVCSVPPIKICHLAKKLDDPGSAGAQLCDEEKKTGKEYESSMDTCMSLSSCQESSLHSIVEMDEIREILNRCCDDVVRSLEGEMLREAGVVLNSTFEEASDSGKNSNEIVFSSSDLCVSSKTEKDVTLEDTSSDQLEGIGRIQDKNCTNARQIVEKEMENIDEAVLQKDRETDTVRDEEIKEKPNKKTESPNSVTILNETCSVSTSTDQENSCDFLVDQAQREKDSTSFESSNETSLPSKDTKMDICSNGEIAMVGLAHGQQGTGGDGAGRSREGRSNDGRSENSGEDDETCATSDQQDDKCDPSTPTRDPPSPIGEPDGVKRIGTSGKVTHMYRLSQKPPSRERVTSDVRDMGLWGGAACKPPFYSDPADVQDTSNRLSSLPPYVKKPRPEKLGSAAPTHESSLTNKGSLHHWMVLDAASKNPSPEENAVLRKEASNLLPSDVHVWDTLDAVSKLPEHPQLSKIFLRNAKKKQVLLRPAAPPPSRKSVTEWMEQKREEKLKSKNPTYCKVVLVRHEEIENLVKNQSSFQSLPSSTLLKEPSSKAKKDEVDSPMQRSVSLTPAFTKAAKLTRHRRVSFDLSNLDQVAESPSPVQTRAQRKRAADEQGNSQKLSKISAEEPSPITRREEKTIRSQEVKSSESSLLPFASFTSPIPRSTRVNFDTSLPFDTTPSFLSSVKTDPSEGSSAIKTLVGSSESNKSSPFMLSGAFTPQATTPRGADVTFDPSSLKETASDNPLQSTPNAVRENRHRKHALRKLSFTPIGEGGNLSASLDAAAFKEDPRFTKGVKDVHKESKDSGLSSPTTQSQATPNTKSSCLRKIILAKRFHDPAADDPKPAGKAKPGAAQNLDRQADDQLTFKPTTAVQVSPLALDSPQLAGRKEGSQIDGPTLDNTYGFKAERQHLGDAKSLHIVQHITTLSIELHVKTRIDLRPDPEMDEIRCLFYCLDSDSWIDPKEGMKTGAIVVDPASVSKEADSQEPSTSRAEVGGVRTRRLFQKSGVTGLEILYVNCESDLFLVFAQLVQKYDPDILVGYEVQMLSWGFLLQRAAHLRLDLCRALSCVPGDEQRNRHDAAKDLYGADNASELHVVGRIVLNLWRLMRTELALYDYSFESVAYHLLHERHPNYDFHTLTNWYDAPARGGGPGESSVHRWRVIDYYVTRVRANLRLLAQQDLIGRTSELARLFGIQFYDVLTRGSQFRVEGMMLRTSRSRNLVAVTPSVLQRAQMRAPEVIALVMEPESKFYNVPVLVLDFQSLYPSMVIAYNLCFSTCLGRVEYLGSDDTFTFGCTNLRVPAKTLSKLLRNNLLTITPSGVAFVRSSVRKGVMPQMLDEILTTRVMVKNSMKNCGPEDAATKRMLDHRQLGLKLIANVTYGYTAANFSGRMPSVEVGDSIVHKARETLERSIQLVNSNSEAWECARVVYGDTDSMFVALEGANNNGCSKDRAFEVGREIAAAVTADNPTPVKLKFEKVFLPCVLETKKRYVGYSYESEDQVEPIFDAKGIETVRRDGTPATAKILEKMLKILFETRDVSKVKQYVLKQCSKLLDGRTTLKDCIIAKEYRGKDYYKPGAVVPALNIARKLLAMDKRAEPRVGERVPYVIVHGAPGTPLYQLVRSPTEVLKDPSLQLNGAYYVTKHVLPALDRVMSLLGVDVFLWHRHLPRTVNVGSHFPTADSQDTTGKKSTISQFFKSKHCFMCKKLSVKSICEECHSTDNSRRQATAVSLALDAKNLERRKIHIEQVCMQCTGAHSASDIRCLSLDCPILYKRHRASDESVKVRALRKALEAEDMF